MLLTRADEMRVFRASGELSDICVIVDKTEFHLHKFPLFLNSEFFKALCRCGMMDENTVTLNEFPGGAKTFSLIADYCYGLDIDINSRNVAQLRCAAEFLQMTSHGNLTNETSTALLRILRSQSASVSTVIEIISSASSLGVIASETNIISLCFDALFTLMKKGNFSERMSEVLMGLPIEWFVGFIIGARDASIAIPIIIRLAGKYLERLVREYKVCINECLEHGGPEHEVYNTGRNGNIMTVQDIGDIMDAILVEFPDNTSLGKVIDSELLCLLFRLAVQLECKCEGILLTAMSNNVSEIPHEIFATMPTGSVVSIAEHSLQNNIVSPAILCNTVDKYLWERTKLKNITFEEFETIVRTIPKQYRPQHDSLLLIAEELFSSTKVSEERKLEILDLIDVYRLHEETLRQISERNVIPSKFIVSSALAVSSRLRNELTEAKLKLAEKDKAIREVHVGISDAIEGQWEYNDIILNVTPQDTSNTRVQFAKVLARNASTGLSMEHEVYDGKLTLCVRSGRGTSTQTFFFDPFNDQLVEITRSKHDNLMVGENYQKKKHTKSYWPFTDVIAS